MIFELGAITLSCLIISVYLGAYLITKGLPESISATYYGVESRWLFPAVIGTSGALTLIPLMNNTPDAYRFVAFFIVAATLFVASAPAFREDMVDKVHAISAAVLGISAVVWLLLTTGCPWIGLGGIVAAVIDRRHFLFWVETGLLYNLYLDLLTVATLNGG